MLLCRAWEDSCDFTLDLLKCNTKHILPSCGHICISALVVCAVGHMLQLGRVTTSPSLPYIPDAM